MILDKHNTTYRISKQTMIFMIAIAIILDLAQLAAKVFYLIGLIAAGAAAGAAVGGAVGLPETGAIVGAAAGGVLILTGIGAAFSFAIGMLMAESLSWVILLFGMLAMWLWFLTKGVPILGGKKMSLKFGTFFLTVIIECIPILNAIPTITFWTWRMAMISRWEDEEAARGATIQKTGLRRRMRARRAARRQTPNGDIQYVDDAIPA